MNIPLTSLEIETLDKVIYTQTFADYTKLQLVLRQLIDQQKDTLISTGQVTAADYPHFQIATVNNITAFLVRNMFYGVREGDVHYLTERGKTLQHHRTIEAFAAWQEGREDKVLTDLHTIEKQGYLEEDQTYMHEKEEEKKEGPLHPGMVAEPERKKYFGAYIAIIIIIIILAALGKSHKWW